MPQAPNLGLTGAGGALAFQNELQKMIAERREAEQLQYERAIAEREWTAKQQEAQAMQAHRTALQQYQAEDLKVRQAAANKPPPASIIQLKRYDDARKMLQTLGVDEGSGQELWRIDTPEAPKEGTRSLQSETRMVNGKLQEVAFDPSANAWLDQQGNRVTVEPVPKEPDPLLAAIRAQTIAMNANVLNQELPPAVAARVDAKAAQYKSEPILNRFNVVAGANRFIQSLSDTTKNPADDQALIYTFAKASDPDSAVRGEEYQIIQKYAQSWLDTFGFNAQRVLQGGEFLTEQARKNIKANIRAKYISEKNGYENLRTQYGKQIDQITGLGDGRSRLVQYDVGFEDAPEVGGGAGGKFTATDPTGKVHEFATQAAADRAKAGWDAYVKSRGGGR